MSDLGKRIANLTPEKRTLLERHLLNKRRSSLLTKQGIRQRGTAAPCVLSFSQQRLWVLDQLEPGSYAYNIPLAIRLSGHLNVTALQQSIAEILRRHEVLRTTFSTENDHPVQRITPATAFSLPELDLSAMPEEQREAKAKQLASEEASLPFDLVTGPLLRATLLRLKPEDHVMLLTMHHIVSDGWSMGIFYRELSVLYEAFSRGKPSPLPDLPIQYADYAVWQRQWLQGEVLEKQLEYWKQKLEGAPSVLELPMDRPRPAVQSYQGASESFVLSSELAEGLKTLSRRENVTLFMTLLAAFKVLLHRYTGSEDIVIGTPIANRTRVELEDLIGFFVNTLVLRTDLSGEPTFLEVLGRVKETALEAYSHQDLPFEKLVEELKPERNLSRSPLFQVMFAFQNVPGFSLSFPDMTIQMVEVDSLTSKFDLSLTIKDSNEGLKASVNYNIDLFDTGTIKRMFEHYEVLLKSIVCNTAQDISKVTILTEAEQHQLLVEWNNKKTKFPEDKCIHHFFEQWADCTPDETAVVIEGQHMDYRELNNKANQLAHYLIKKGVRPEMPVGICLERSLDMIVGMIGILKAGGAYVPLDPAYPRDRLSFMVKDAQLTVLVTQDKLTQEINENSAHVIDMKKDLEKISQESESNPFSTVQSSNLAYIMYTSGSTGRPKGVMISHRNVVGFLYSYKKVTLDRKRRIGTSVATFSFDTSVEEIFSNLCFGGSLHIVRPENSIDAEYFARYLVDHHINTTFILPDLLVDIAGYLEKLKDRLDLRCLITGLAPKKQSILQRVREVLPETLILNAYGPTEVTYGATAFDFHSADDPDQDVPIGKPFPNYEVYIVDANLQPVSIGVRGEILIGGVGLSNGYLNRPELTDEKFIPHLFSKEPGAKLYRTGDLGRYLHDGNIEFLGRIDNQVKIRGFRIEPGEIEAVLRLHPEIIRAAVIAREDHPGDKRLIAYIVLRNRHFSINELSLFLKSKLPSYMIPSAFVMLDDMPLMPNGKIDRGALPAPDYSKNISGKYFVPPRTSFEKIIAGTWSELLGIETIGIHDNFFELGGHSLLATQVVSRLNKIFNITIPLRSFFEMPTVKGLGRVIEEFCVSDSGPSHCPVELLPVARDMAPTLSFAQQRLWFLAKLDPDSPTYNVSSAIRLKGELSKDALQKSLDEIVRRHEVLRTTYIEQDGSPIQEIHEAMQLDIRQIDLSGKPEISCEAEAADILTEEAQKPFDLSIGPLLRAILLRLDEQEHILMITIHHIAYDGWSNSVFIRELSALYGAYSKGETSPLPELTIQYADYAVWQRQWLQGEVLEKQLSYWRQKLEGAPSVLELPMDRPRPAVQTYQGASESFVLSSELAEGLKALSRRENVTLFMTLLAAFKVLLYRYTGSEDIVIGTPIANRTRVELEDLIGLFVNTLVLRTDLSGEPTFLEVLGRVKETALEAYSHQDLPFEKLVEELKPERNLSYAPLFQVMFVLQNAAGTGPGFSDITLIPIEVDSGTSKFDLTLSITECGDGLDASINYNRKLFDNETIVRIARHFQTLLKAVATDPASRISEILLLSEIEKQQILMQWNDTGRAYPADTCVHFLFEEQVQRTPDAVAVASREGALTFKELNIRCNQLARYLKSQGAGPEVITGIFMESSLEMIICLMGILKAGGAYLPMDPLLPLERLAYMIKDSHTDMVLTVTSMRDKIKDLPVRMICIDQEKESISGFAQTNPEKAAAIDNQCYVIYTSGSSGRPKGVVVEHRQLLNYVYGIMERTGMRPGFGYAMLQPLTVDSCKTVIFPPLCFGGTLHLIPRERALDVFLVSEYFRSNRIDVLKIAPSHLSALLNSPEAGNLLPKQLLIIGGEISPQDLIQEIKRLSPSLEVFNHYGPTETTVGVLAYRIGQSPAGESRSLVPIGRPLPNTRIYLLDRAMQPVPIGVSGELYISGKCLARGYLNQPKMTQERFLQNPFSHGTGERLYRTGDLARYLPDGQIEFLGRMDDQIKVRGFRVETGEVEATLKQHPSVHEALVLIRDIQGRSCFVAYVIAKGPSPAVRELHEHLRKMLPEYMVPSYFVFLDKLPLTAHGKVDRRALPLPDLSHRILDEAYVPSRTSTEEVITGILAEVLGIAQIGIHDNFFALGGHSLLAIQVIARINKVFDVNISLRSFFEAPTIAGLSSLLHDICWQIQGRDLTKNKSGEYTVGEL